jgi:hypothetical protein
LGQIKGATIYSALLRIVEPVIQLAAVRGMSSVPSSVVAFDTMRLQEAVDSQHELGARSRLAGVDPMLVMHEELRRRGRRPADVLSKACGSAQPWLRCVLLDDVRA